MKKMQSLFAAQQAFMAMLVCELDKRGAVDGQGLCAVYASIGAQMPDPDMREAFERQGEQVLKHVTASRLRNGGPTSAQH